MHTGKRSASLELTLVPLARPWLILSKNPDDHPPPKRTVKPGGAFEVTAFKRWLKIVNH